jgi:hypothetical protein
MRTPLAVVVMIVGVALFVTPICLTEVPFAGDKDGKP